jgi:uncharacterized membrane protein YfcA
MHVAVATSLAAIIPHLDPVPARTHHSRGAVDWQLAKSWGPGNGARRGGRQSLASHAPLPVLAGVFGTVALLIAAKYCCRSMICGVASDGRAAPAAPLPAP